MREYKPLTYPSNDENKKLGEALEEQRENPATMDRITKTNELIFDPAHDFDLHVSRKGAYIGYLELVAKAAKLLGSMQFD